MVVNSHTFSKFVAPENVRPLLLVPWDNEVSWWQLNLPVYLPVHLQAVHGELCIFNIASKASGSSGTGNGSDQNCSTSSHNKHEIVILCCTQTNTVSRVQRAGRLVQLHCMTTRQLNHNKDECASKNIMWEKLLRSTTREMDV